MPTVTYPAVSFRRDRAVLAEDGDYRVVTGPEGRPLDPVDLIETLAKDFERVLILDLDAIHRDSPQMELMQDMPSGIEIWLDGGVRIADDMYDLFMSGPEKVVIGTKTLSSFKALEEMHKDSEELILSLDLHDGAVVISDKELEGKSVLDVAKAAKLIGIDEFIVAEMTAPSVDPAILRELLDVGVTLHATGSRADLARFEELGLAGLIIPLKEVLEDE